MIRLERLGSCTRSTGWYMPTNKTGYFPSYTLATNIPVAGAIWFPAITALYAKTCQLRFFLPISGILLSA